MSLRIGYVPYTRDFSHPGDRRRFSYYAAKRGLTYEIADPAREYDVVVLSEAADISVWRHFPVSRGRVVYDLIDSYLAIPDSDLRSRLRGPAKFLSRQTRRLELNYRRGIIALCQRADAVTCTTVEQEAMIREYCPNTHVILDFHAGAVRKVKSEYAAGDVFHLVWEGQAGNVSTFSLIRDALSIVAAKHRIALHLVTDLEYPLGLKHVGRLSTKALIRRTVDIPGVYLYEWNEAMFAHICTACDLAVIPIPMDQAIYAGKPENKMLIFWRMGIPVVASATPAYRRAMAAAGHDLACTTTDDWVKVLSACIEDEALRRAAGTNGRHVAETEYGEEVTLARWDRAMTSVLGDSFPGS
jgi:glycosyltransferase involved in cell wall biosynthesis